MHAIFGGAEKKENIRELLADKIIFPQGNSPPVNWTRINNAFPIFTHIP